jgi:putative ABC transport system permease protein
LFNAPLGFTKSRTHIVPLSDTRTRHKVDELRKRLLAAESIEGVTVLEDVLGASHQSHYYRLPDQEKGLFIHGLQVGAGFAETFEIDVVAGKDFSADVAVGQEQVLVNEAFIKHFGYASPEAAVGTKLYAYKTPKTIAGVLKDFNYKSLHSPIGPFVVGQSASAYSKLFSSRYICIRYKENMRRQGVRDVGKVWATLYPDSKLNLPEHINDEIFRLYRDELSLVEISLSFALVAIFIAALGLFGVSSFITGQRKKEVAIRKALGITNTGVIWLLLVEFLLLIFCSILITWPIGYLVLENWLSGFSYRVQLGWQEFAITGTIVLAVSLFTVSYQVIRAARRSPINDLQG